MHLANQSGTRRSASPMTVKRSALASAAGFAFLDCGSSLANALAKVRELGAADGAVAFHFDFFDARRMHRENAFDAFAVADASDGECRVHAASSPSDDYTGKDLNSFFVAFDDFGVHTDGVTDGEIEGLFAELFRFNFIE